MGLSKRLACELIVGNIHTHDRINWSVLGFMVATVNSVVRAKLTATTCLVIQLVYVANKYTERWVCGRVLRAQRFTKSRREDAQLNTPLRVLVNMVIVRWVKLVLERWTCEQVLVPICYWIRTKITGSLLNFKVRGSKFILAKGNSPFLK